MLLDVSTPSDTLLLLLLVLANHALLVIIRRKKRLRHHFLVRLFIVLQLLVEIDLVMDVVVVLAEQDG